MIRFNRDNQLSIAKLFNKIRLLYYIYAFCTTNKQTMKAEEEKEIGKIVGFIETKKKQKTS